MCNKNKSALEILLTELATLAIDVQHHRRMLSHAQMFFDAKCKFFRCYAPDVFSEIMRVCNATPEPETLDVEFELID
jgi:hypothetical protein